MSNPTLSEVYFQGMELHKELDKLYQSRLKQIDMNLQELNVKALKDQGFEYIEVGGDGYWFEDGDYTYWVESAGEDRTDTLKMAIMHSPCCGEEVDEDYMICPKCYEHV